jgi:hypothetical protein
VKNVLPHLPALPRFRAVAFAAAATAANAALLRVAVAFVAIAIVVLAPAPALLAQSTTDDAPPFRLFHPEGAHGAIPPARPVTPSSALAEITARTSATGRQEAARALLTRRPELAAEATTYLLSRAVALPEALAKSLTGDALTAAVKAHAAFPDQLDSAFLRAAAASTDDAAATAALALLASRHSIKNNATLVTLAAAAASGNIARLAAVLKNYESDSEFYRIPRWSNAGDDNSNDPYFGGGSPKSILGAAGAGDSQPDLRRVGAHIPPEQQPSLQAMFHFLGAVETALGPKANIPQDLRNRAYEILLAESASPSLPNIVEQLLRPDPKSPNDPNGGSPEARRLAQSTALRYADNPRLLELVLKAVEDGRVRLADSVLADFAPLLVRDDGLRTRTLARFARLLVLRPEPERRLPGLMLLAAHGVPSDAALFHPRPGALTADAASALKSADPYVRRATAHVLARIAPEVFFFHAAEIAADPDPVVRAVFPVALFKTGYRWEHVPAAGVRVAEWVTPTSPPVVGPGLFDLLRQLTSDPDAQIATNARLALLQHGMLDAGDALADLALPADSGLPTARLLLVASSMRAAGLPLPRVLEAFAPVKPPASQATNQTRQAISTVIAVFSPAGGPVAEKLDAAVAELRHAFPELRVVLFYHGTEAAAVMFDSLRRVFPISAGLAKDPVIAVSSGAFVVTKDAPDFALLRELVEHARLSGTRRVENILLQVIRETTRPVEEEASGEFVEPPLPNFPKELRHNLENRDEPPDRESPFMGLWFFIGFVIFSVVAAIGFIGGFYLWRWYRDRIEHPERHHRKKRQR